MNTKFKKIVGKFQEAQTAFNNFVNESDIVGKAKDYANKQSKEIKKFFAPDAKKMRQTLEKEKKNLEMFKKDLPRHMKKLGNFIEKQTNEISKVLAKISAEGPKKAKPRTKTKAKPRKTVRKKSAHA
jgi:hypothetical protein